VYGNGNDPVQGTWSGDQKKMTVGPDPKRAPTCLRALSTRSPRRDKTRDRSAAFGLPYDDDEDDDEDDDVFRQSRPSLVYPKELASCKRVVDTPPPRSAIRSIGSYVAKGSDRLDRGPRVYGRIDGIDRILRREGI